MSEEERNAILTFVHELDHFRNIVGTPLGLLLWRCEEVVLDATARLTRELCACGIDGFPPGKPLLDWFDEEGEAFIKGIAASGRLPALFRPPDPGTDELGTVLDELRSVVRHICTVQRFVNILLGDYKPTPTIGAFLDVANEATSMVARRWNLRRFSGWHSKLKRSHPLYPDRDRLWSISTTEMLEASARLRELEIMGKAGASPSWVEQWEKRSVVGVYAQGSNRLLSQLEDPIISAGIANLALTVPIDLEHPLGLPLHVYAEDALPFMRASRLADAVKSLEKLPRDQLQHSLQMHGLDNVLLEAAGLPTLEATYAVPIRQAKLGMPRVAPLFAPQGNSQAQPAVAYDHRRYAKALCKKFEQGLREAFNNGMSETALFKLYIDFTPEGQKRYMQAMRDREGTVSAEPDVTFFADNVALAGGYRGNEVYTYADNLAHYVMTQACQALQHPTRAMADPLPLVEAFVRRLHLAAKPLDPPVDENTPYGRAVTEEYTREQDPAWQTLREAWATPEAAVAQIWQSIADEFGAAAARSIRDFD